MWRFRFPAEVPAGLLSCCFSGHEVNPGTRGHWLLWTVESATKRQEAYDPRKGLALPVDLHPHSEVKHASCQAPYIGRAEIFTSRVEALWVEPYEAPDVLNMGSVDTSPGLVPRYLACWC